MELEIPISKIHIKETRTDAVPNSSPTGASVATDINGMAVVVCILFSINAIVFGFF